MGNILAIAQKELKSYFASPIAYIVIGLWALLYGYFFAAILHYFAQQSMQMNQFGMQGPQTININQRVRSDGWWNKLTMAQKTSKTNRTFKVLSCGMSHRSSVRPGISLRLCAPCKAEAKRYIAR